MLLPDLSLRRAVVRPHHGDQSVAECCSSSFGLHNGRGLAISASVPLDVGLSRRRKKTHNRPSQKTVAPIMSVRTRKNSVSCSSECTSRKSTRILHGSAVIRVSVFSRSFRTHKHEEERAGRTSVADPVGCPWRPMRRNQVSSADGRNKQSLRSVLAVTLIA